MIRGSLSSLELLLKSLSYPFLFLETKRVIVDFEDAALSDNTLVETSYREDGFVVTASSPAIAMSYGDPSRSPDEFRISNANAEQDKGGPAVQDFVTGKGDNNQAAVAVRERDLIIQYFGQDWQNSTPLDFKFRGLYASRPASGTFNLTVSGWKDGSLVKSYTASVVSGGFVRSRIRGSIDRLVIDDGNTGGFAIDDLKFDVPLASLI
jgi:hypothetical protein